MDGRFRPDCAAHSVYWLGVFIVEPNLVGISAFLLVMLRRRWGIRERAIGPLYERMTSSKKRKYTTYRKAARGGFEPRSRATCTKNSVKFSRAVFELCERTDKQTHGQKDKHANKYRVQYRPKGESLALVGEQHKSRHVIFTLCTAVIKLQQAAANCKT